MRARLVTFLEQNRVGNGLVVLVPATLLFCVGVCGNLVAASIWPASSKNTPGLQAVSNALGNPFLYVAAAVLFASAVATSWLYPERKRQARVDLEAAVRAMPVAQAAAAEEKSGKLVTEPLADAINRIRAAKRSERG